MKYKFIKIFFLATLLASLFTSQITFAQEANGNFVDEQTIQLFGQNYILNENAAPPGYYRQSGSECPAQPDYIELNFNELDIDANTVSASHMTASQVGGGCGDYRGQSVIIGNFSASGIDQSQIDDVLGEDESCEGQAYSVGFKLGWLLCGVIDGLGGAIEGIFNWILGYEEGQPGYCNLVINIGSGNESTANCPAFNSESVRQTWGAFRTLANAFFALAFIYAIYQVLFASGNNAYLIRSMVPKIAAAAILVQLSFFLSSILIEFSNELGSYVSSVFDWVFQSQTGQEDWSPGAILFGADDQSLLDHVLSSGFMVIGIVAAFVSLATIFSTLALMLIVVFVVLVARKLLILIALILAPIAAITWIHPETDGFAKAWWQVFSKLLLMYPIIILLIKSGELMARATSGSGGPVEFDMVRFVAYFAPFFLIPFSFKFAGGLIGQVAGITNNAAKGWTDRARNYDQRRGEFRKRQKMARFGNTPEKGIFNKAKRGYYRATTGTIGLTKYGRAVEGSRLAGARKEQMEIAQGAVGEALAGVAGEDQKDVLAASMFGKKWSDYKKGQIESDYQEGRISKATRNTNLQRIETKAQQLDAATKAINKSGSASRVAAGAMLVETFRGLNEFEQFYDQVNTSGSYEDRADLNRITSATAGTLATFGPHLLKGVVPSLSANAEQLTQYKPEAIGSMTDRALQYEVAGESKSVFASAAGMDTMTSNLVQALSSPETRNEMNVETAAAYYQNVSKYLNRYYDAATDTVNVPTSIENPVERQTFEAHVRAVVANHRQFDQYLEIRPTPTNSDPNKVTASYRVEGASPVSVNINSNAGGNGGGSFEQRKQQVIQSAQQRNIPIIDERAITPESIESFESMYDIAPASPPPQPATPPTTQADLGTQETRSRINKRRDTLGAYDSGESQGRHSAESTSNTGGRHEADPEGDAQDTTSEGRHLRPDDNDEGNS